MPKKRTRLEIIRDILEVIQNKSGKIKPTHILYKSNLSYQMMDDYIKELTSKGFIKRHKKETGTTFAITEKGRQYLSQYQVINEFTNMFGLAEET
ncbi:DUF4364 family protein [Candidatus Pacearchaeota archaeon]|nr:hypothetical protein [uncultured archaeon]AQS34034.1 hypothetical protein [uncultured archaeon]AQS34083.1 hypothetical protein [uncultured archaeon]MBS3089942.1 DUF4364 family protein [Candidatus Pacearchaeota archaeon]